jgi:hypothetical protein
LAVAIDEFEQTRTRHVRQDGLTTVGPGGDEGTFRRRKKDSAYLWVAPIPLACIVRFVVLVRLADRPSLTDVPVQGITRERQSTRPMCGRFNLLFGPRQWAHGKSGVKKARDISGITFFASRNVCMRVVIHQAATGLLYGCCGNAVCHYAGQHRKCRPNHLFSFFLGWAWEEGDVATEWTNHSQPAMTRPVPIRKVESHFYDGLLPRAPPSHDRANQRVHAQPKSNTGMPAASDAGLQMRWKRRTACNGWAKWAKKHVIVCCLWKITHGNRQR